MTDDFVREALESFTASPDDAVLDWADVVRRAEGTGPALRHSGTNGAVVPRRRRRLPRWVPVAIAAALAACSLALVSPVGSAIARTLADFTGWLTGEPGDPVSPVEQEAFERATRTWEGFPPDAELRRLAETKAAGSTLTLYGFRGAGSLCLRLVVSGAHSARELTCLPLSELEARRQPALVVAADYSIGADGPPAAGPFPFPASAAQVTYGVVADGVDRVELRRTDGTTSNAVVSGDAFLSIDENPSYTDRVSNIWAVTGDRRVAIPFAPDRTLFGFSGASVPEREARGPATVQRRLHGGAIRWLARRQPRGVEVPKNVHHIVGVLTDVVFARQITPDPGAPERMVVSRRPDQVCAELVGGRYQGGSCWPAPRLFSTAPFAWGVTQGSGQYVTVAGLASDDVSRLVLYPAVGEKRRVPLHDNGYAIEASRAAYPLRLVAYDRAGLVIGSVTFKGDQQPAFAIQPAPNATWHSVIRNELGEIFVARAERGGTCTAIRLASGGGSISCRPPLPAPSTLELSYGRSGDGPTILSGRTGASVTRLVVRYRNGSTETVAARRGHVLAALHPPKGKDDPPGLGGLMRSIASIAGLDAAGDQIALKRYDRAALVSGAATIRALTRSSVSFGPSRARAAKLRAEGKAPRLTTCRRTAGSPPLDGYRPGVYVQFLCERGALGLIGRAIRSASWPNRTILGAGRITALGSSSLTIRNERARDTGGQPAPLTCAFGPTSPSTNRYARGQRVQVFCAGGKLTGINRGDAGP